MGSIEKPSAASGTGIVGVSRQPPSADTATGDASDEDSWAHTVRANAAIVRRRLLFFIVVTLLFLVAAMLVDRVFPSMYSSVARAAIAPNYDRVSTLDAVVTPVQVNELGFMQTQLEVLKSGSLLAAVASEEGLEKSIDELSTPFDLLAELVGRITGGEPASGSNPALAHAAQLFAARLKANVVKDTSVLQILVSTRDPALSKRLTQRVLDKYVELTGKERTQRLEAGAAALRDRLAAQGSAVDKAVAALRAYDERTDGLRRVTTSETVTTTRPNNASSSNTQTEREDAKIAERAQLEWKVSTERVLYQVTSSSLENIRVALDTLRSVSLVTVLDPPALSTSPDGLKSWMRYLIYVLAAPAFGLFATYVLYLIGVYRRSGRRTRVTA